MQSHHLICIALHFMENLRRAYAKNVVRIGVFKPEWYVIENAHPKTTVVVESNSDSSVVGLDSDENDVSEISISDNNFDTEENIEIQIAMPISECISDVIQSPFTDLY